MDNHKGAFVFWHKLGIQEATCVHVDAHLDVSNFQVPEPGELEYSELNCGNFLFPAMRDRMVAHLIWVLPPHLYGDKPFLEWAKGELQNWMWMTVAEYRSMRLHEGRVEMTLAGARLTLCTIDNLPAVAPDKPILADVDIDYFFALDEDTVWQSPIELCDRLNALPHAVVTVATSLEGGYTPPQHRYIGELCMACLTGRRTDAVRWWDALQSRTAPPDAPEWLTLAIRALKAPGFDAREWPYEPRPLDMAGYYYQRKRYDEMRPWLARDDSEASAYLRGLLAFRKSDHAEAEREWTALARHEMATGLLGAHLHDLLGKVYMAQGRYADAVASFQAATRQAPELANLYRQLGEAQIRAGQPEAGARTWRRAIALAPDDLATLPIRLGLAEHYISTGQRPLAATELRIVASQDDGALAAKACLLSMELK